MRRRMHDAGADELRDRCRVPNVLWPRGLHQPHCRDMHVSRHDRHARFLFGREVQQVADQSSTLSHVWPAAPVIAHVVFQVLMPWNPTEQCLGVFKARINDRNARQHQQVRQAIGITRLVSIRKPSEQFQHVVPSARGQNLLQAPLAAKVGCQDANVVDALEPREPRSLGSRPTLLRNHARGGDPLLKHSEPFRGALINRLRYFRRQPVGVVRTPAIEDVVIVPHHQRRDAGHHFGDRLGGPASAIDGLEIMLVDRLFELLGGLLFFLFGGIEIVPTLQLGHGSEDRVAINLIATHQQQVKMQPGTPLGVLLVLLEQVRPTVKRRRIAGNALHGRRRRKAVARRESHLQRRLLAGEIKSVLRASHFVVHAPLGLSGRASHVKVVSQHNVLAAAGRKLGQRLRIGNGLFGLPLHGECQLRLLVGVQHDERRHLPRHRIGTAKSQDRTKYQGHDVVLSSEGVRCVERIRRHNLGLLVDKIESSVSFHERFVTVPKSV
ncbi:MAG: hypothetical protein FD138_1197 [Planctomycetota bacterium]|nr:MAG: hypothetical protein FD138_1197 [Planctomycetota bacterium]